MQHSSAQSLGMVYIFTGDGKGKTSAALGTLTRALAHGWKVGWISWYKEASWGVSEHALSSILNSEAQQRLILLPMGKGFYIKSATSTIRGIKTVQSQSAVIMDDDSPDAHKQAAQQALAKAEELLPQVDVLIMDEVCNAISDRLLKEHQVIDVLAKRGKTHVILTGRSASLLLCEKADLVSQIQKIKHPYDQGKMAVKGLDF